MIHFSALPSGIKYPYASSFIYINEQFIGWLYLNGLSQIGFLGLDAYSDQALTFTASYPINNLYGCSVRLVKIDNQTPIGSTYTDLNGHIYDVVHFQDLIFLRQSYACTKYQDGSEIPLISNDSDWNTTNVGACCSYNYQKSNAYFI